MSDLAPDVQMKLVEYLIAQENSTIQCPEVGFGLFTSFFVGMLIGGIVVSIAHNYMKAK